MRTLLPSLARPLLACFCLLAAVSTLRADPVWFALDDVSFTSGGSASGYFQYDPGAGMFSFWEVSTSSSADFPAFDYNVSDSIAYANTDGCSVLFSSGAGQSALCLNEGAVSSAGDYDLLASSYERSANTLRYVLPGGAIVDPQTNPGATVPEPATLALAAIGVSILLGLGSKARA